MEHLEELERRINQTGWFGGRLSVNITFEREFEGFFGKASETWETRITIKSNEVREKDKVIFPNIEVIGKRHENVNDIAKKFNTKLNEYSKELSDNELLNLYGWDVTCESPFEICTKDGSFASEEAAYIVLNSLKRYHYNG